MRLFGWLANPVLIIYFLSKQSHDFPKKLGNLVINYFLPKLLVSYSIPQFNKENPNDHNVTGWTWNTGSLPIMPENLPGEIPTYLPFQEPGHLWANFCKMPSHPSWLVTKASGQLWMDEVVDGWWMDETLFLQMSNTSRQFLYLLYLYLGHLWAPNNVKSHPTPSFFRREKHWLVAEASVWTWLDEI